MCVSIPGGGTLNSTTKFNCINYENTAEPWKQKDPLWGCEPTHVAPWHLFVTFILLCMCLCVRGHMCHGRGQLAGIQGLNLGCQA